jgi:hypothetical protein
LGGSGDDFGFGITLDSSGNAYVSGTANSSDFPTTAGAFQTACTNDAFVSKLNSSGSALLYSSCLGGAQHFDYGSGIAVDSSGSAYVTGTAPSNDFPTTSGAFQTAFGGGPEDAFVSKFALGSNLTFAGHPGSPNCHGKSVSALAHQYGSVSRAFSILGYPSVKALQGAIKAYCR